MLTIAGAVVETRESVYDKVFDAMPSTVTDTAYTPLVVDGAVTPTAPSAQDVYEPASCVPKETLDEPRLDPKFAPAKDTASFGAPLDGTILQSPGRLVSLTSKSAMVGPWSLFVVSTAPLDVVSVSEPSTAPAGTATVTCVDDHAAAQDGMDAAIKAPLAPVNEIVPAADPNPVPETVT